MFRLLSIALISMGALPIPSIADAQSEQPNVTIIGEGADLDTIPRDNRIFNRVPHAVEGELQPAGILAYHKTAVLMDVTNPSLMQSSDAEMIMVGRRLHDVPINVVAYGLGELPPLPARGDRDGVLQCEDILGLARGFLFAGARSLLVSNWSVDDSSANELMIQTMQNSVQRKMTRAQALRQAILNVMQSPDRDFKHPFFWAAFNLVGEN